jgi:hypothetical protein
LFEPDRSIRFTFHPQEGRTFPTSRNPGMLSLPRFGGCPNKTARNPEKTIRIGHIINHESGESIGNIQRDVSTVSNRCINIQALYLQSVVETISV